MKCICCAHIIGTDIRRLRKEFGIVTVQQKADRNVKVFLVAEICVVCQKKNVEPDVRRQHAAVRWVY